MAAGGWQLYRRRQMFRLLLNAKWTNADMELRLVGVQQPKRDNVLRHCPLPPIHAYGKIYSSNGTYAVACLGPFSPRRLRYSAIRIELFSICCSVAENIENNGSGTAALQQVPSVKEQW
jgi:hypothetical protein